jgi:2,4-dienoyl-CoA reductase-like NADH-dependent reductase (Old Yellow Enzyme family)
LRDDPLLRPLTVKGITFKNRVMSTAHAPGYAEGGLPGERYQLYHEQKARGGLALTMFGGNSTVATDAPSGHIDVSTDRCVAPFRQFAERIHAFDCALMCQISHMGRRTRAGRGALLPVIAPSAVREKLGRSFAKPMEGHDIARTIAAFAAAAGRCRAAGLDGVELLATSHLLGQFLSPLANRRTDGYGGSFVNRARFACEVLEAVRGAVGEDFIVSLRLSGDEMMQGGLSAAECTEVAAFLAAGGRIDVLNVLGGNAWSEPGMSRNMPGMGTPTAPFLTLAAAVRERTGLPVFHGTRITDLETARHAVANGMLDMVAMTRGHMADPDIVTKLQQDQVDRIRPCVGARNCLDGALHGGSSVCIHNPATGREATVPQHVQRTTGRRYRVVVVGGGPAGLEAARVCALRGHDVSLFEAGERLGGQVLIAARARGRAEIGEIVGWLARENAHAGVAPHLGAFMEGPEVLASRPDVVVDATGGLPSFGDVHDPDGLLLSTWDVLSGARTVTGTVLLFDDHGGHQGLSCAATLAARDDIRLVVATPERALGNGMGDVNRPQYLEPLYGSAATLLPDRELTAVVRDGNRVRAELHNTYIDQTETLAVDHVVMEAGSEANTMLYDTLSPSSANRGIVDLALLAAGQAQPVPADGFALWRVGDAVVHRGIHAAILESRRLCQNL